MVYEKNENSVNFRTNLVIFRSCTMPKCKCQDALCQDALCQDALCQDALCQDDKLSLFYNIYYDIDIQSQ